MGLFDESEEMKSFNGMKENSTMMQEIYQEDSEGLKGGESKADVGSGEQEKSEVIMTLMIPRTEEENAAEENNEMIWTSTSVHSSSPLAPTATQVFDVKEETAASTQSASSDSNDSSDEKMMILGGEDGLDIGENSN